MVADSADDGAEDSEIQKLRFQATELIFSEGDVADCAYLVEDGWVEILATQKGLQTSLSLIGPGQIFGEMGVIDGFPRSATAVAAKDCRLLRITTDQFHSWMSKSEPFHGELLMKLVARFREAQRAFLQGNVVRRTESSELGPGFAMLARNRDIADALDRGEIEPFLQPIVQMETGRWIGFEALARWRSPEQGLVVPADFLPLSERTGLIRRIDFVIAERAMTLCRDFPGATRPLLHLNFSAWHFHDDTLCLNIRSLLDRTGIDPGLVCIELTETLMLDDPERALTVMNDLASLGLKLALDDFGTGYSSLSVLSRMPIHVLKIDRTLIADMLTDERPKLVLRNIIALAHDLGMEISVEGVEDRAMVETLLQLGCRTCQGFLFARPLPADQAAEQWRAQQALTEDAAG